MNEGPDVGALPEQIRERVIGYAASALPDVPNLPPALRRVSSFAPARRARLGAGAITTALDDADLRESVAAQLRGRVPAPQSPLERAAQAWLLRDEGWQETYDTAVGALLRPEPEEPRTERLRARVERLEQELAATRADRKARVEELKTENAALRRKLGDIRSTVRQTTAGHDEALAKAEAARDEAEAQVAAHERTLRQLRAQIDRLEAAGAAERRTAKDGEQAATVRARLLLDTLLEAAGGLRRELALPPVAGSPADAIESALAARSTPGERSGRVQSPSQLQQYLSMPRVRLIVDGYNVSKALWPTSTLEAQRSRLLQAMGPIVARTGAETTVVFDAAAAEARTVVPAPRGVRVVFSPAGVIADDVIRELVGAEPVGRVVLVVSDDQQVARDVMAAGARAAGVSILQGILERG